MVGAGLEKSVFQNNREKFIFLLVSKKEIRERLTWARGVFVQKQDHLHGMKVSLESGKAGRVEKIVGEAG